MPDDVEQLPGTPVKVMNQDKAPRYDELPGHVATSDEVTKYFRPRHTKPAQQAQQAQQAQPAKAQPKQTVEQAAQSNVPVMRAEKPSDTAGINVVRKQIEALKQQYLRPGDGSIVRKTADALIKNPQDANALARLRLFHVQTQQAVMEVVDQTRRRRAAIDPNDPLARAHQMAAEEGGVKGFLRENVAAAVDPRALAVSAVLPGAESLAEGVALRAGTRLLGRKAGVAAARAVPRVAKMAAGAAGAGMMAPQVKQAMREKDYPRAAAAAAAGGLSLLAGALGARAGRRAATGAATGAAEEPAQQFPQRVVHEGKTYEFQGVGENGKPRYKVVNLDEHSISRKETGNATKEGQKPQGGEREHPGAAQRADVRAHEGEVRKGEGEQAGDSHRTQPGAKEQEGKTTGIAHRVNVRRAGEGAVAEVPRGKGVTPEQMVQRGEDILKKRNPEIAMQRAEKRGVASADDIALFRAHQRQLAQATDAAQDALRKTPNDPALQQAVKQAMAADTAWLKRIKVFSTEAHRVFVAHQGEQDIASGSFSALTRSYRENLARPRDMTPAEMETAQQHAERIKNLNAQVDDLKRQLNAALSSQLDRKARSTGASAARRAAPSMDRTALSDHLAKRLKDGTFFEGGGRSMGKGPKARQRGAASFHRGKVAPDVARAIWRYATDNYIDSGATFEDTLHGVATDLGIPRELVAEAFDSNKTVRQITPQIYGKLADRRAAVNAARNWIETNNMGPARRAWRAVTILPRSVAVFGHGGVGMVTHAGENIYRPTTWPDYWRNFRRQLPYTFNPAFHERMMTQMETDPQYNAWRQAGLNIDPNRIYDDYQLYGKFLGKAGQMGNRGMDALKTFRFEYAKRLFDKLPASMKGDPEVRKELATYVNHISGSGDMGHGQIAGVVKEAMFAPSLEASRWARAVGDPLRAVKIAANWNNATPADQLFAKKIAGRAVELSAVLISTLAANDALLKQTGQKDRVNFTDPSKADWLRPKWRGKTLDVTGNATAPVRLLGQVFKALESSPKQRRGEGRFSYAAGKVGQYARGKLAPQYGIATDVATREDMMGRPLPHSEKAGTASRPKYTWPEYGAQHIPIPLAESAREYFDTMHKQGVDHATAQAVLDAVKAFPIALTGARIGQTPPPPEPRKVRPRKIKLSMPDY